MYTFVYTDLYRQHTPTILCLCMYTKVLFSHPQRYTTYTFMSIWTHKHYAHTSYWHFLKFCQGILIVKLFTFVIQLLFLFCFFCFFFFQLGWFFILGRGKNIVFRLADWQHKVVVLNTEYLHRRYNQPSIFFTCYLGGHFNCLFFHVCWSIFFFFFWSNSVVF